MGGMVGGGPPLILAIPVQHSNTHFFGEALEVTVHPGDKALIPCLACDKK